MIHHRTFPVVMALFIFAGKAPGLSAQTATPTPLPAAGDGAAVTFFSNPNLTGSTFSTQYENIDTDFFECSPDPSIPSTAFSGRFTAEVEPVYSEPYTFTVNLEGGARLAVNGVTLVNQFTTDYTSFTQFSGAITLTALQRVPVVLEYFKNTGPAAIDLFWQSPSQAQEVVPLARLYSGLPAGPAVPPPPTQASIYAQGITVDGQVTSGAWTGTWTPLAKVVWGQNLSIPADFQSHWDSNYFYVGCRVYNPTPHNSSPEYFNDDSVEIFLSMNNDRSVTLQPGDFHYSLEWGNNALAEDNNRITGVLAQTATTSYGYSAVLAIPWSTLGVTPSASSLYGFDVGVNLSPLGGCPLSRLRWNGTNLDVIDTRFFGQVGLAQPIPTPPTPQGNPYVYSNPAVGPEVHFVYSMAEKGTAKIRVWNQSGDLVASLDDSKPSGTQQSDLGIQTFASGHYFYRVVLQYDSGRVDKFGTLILDVKK
jgi:hypothetical protein